VPAPTRHPPQSSPPEPQPAPNLTRGLGAAGGAPGGTPERHLLKDVSGKTPKTHPRSALFFDIFFRDTCLQGRVWALPFEASGREEPAPRGGRALRAQSAAQFCRPGGRGRPDRGTGHAETRDRTGDLQIFSLTLSQLSYRGFWAGRLGFGPSLGASVNRDQPRPSCGPGWEQPRSLLAGRLPHRWPGARASPGTASQRLTARPETFCQST
jgi:hypothetical protein